MNKRRKPRILLVSHSAGGFGAERSLLTLADGLQARGLAEVVVLLPEAGPLLDGLRSQGIDCHVVRYYPWVGYAGARLALLKRFARVPLTLVGALKAWRWAKTWNPDLIYINTVASPMGLILATLLRKPHVWHVREWIREDLQTKYDLGRAPVMWLINRSGSVVIFNSRAVAQAHEKHLPAVRSVVVYNGFDFSDVPAPDASRRYEDTVVNAPVVRMAVIGSVQPAKGQEDAIRALPALCAAGLAVRLEIMGTGVPDYVAHLERLADDLAVSHCVSFRGYIANVCDELSPIALVLVPSRYEPFGRVAVEAQSRGVPVIAAAVGGLKEIVLDGKTGLLFPPGDFTQLAAKAAVLLKERALYESIVVEAWRHATREFTQGRYVAGIWDVVSKMIDADAVGEARAVS